MIIALGQFLTRKNVFFFFCVTIKPWTAFVLIFEFEFRKQQLFIKEENALENFLFFRTFVIGSATNMKGKKIDKIRKLNVGIDRI